VRIAKSLPTQRDELRPGDAAWHAKRKRAYLKHQSCSSQSKILRKELCLWIHIKHAFNQ
jgi:hypothetical protein